MSLEHLESFLIAYSDSAFTNPHEVALDRAPPDRAGQFTHMGAQYWGFETSRHIATSIDVANQRFRFDPKAHHYLKLGLTARAQVAEIHIDTTWFTGNHVPSVSVILEDGESSVEVLTKVSLSPDQSHKFQISPTYAERCLVLCHQEGGIARVALMGTPGQWSERHNLLEDADISFVSNDHYGHPRDAVRGKRLEQHMKGWESARSGFGEQAVFSFPSPIEIRQFVVDTYLHRLNAPLSCHLFGLTDTHNLVEVINHKPRWALKAASGQLTLPEDFQAYMSNQRYLDDGLGDQAFTIELHNPAPGIWLPLLPFAPLYPDRYHIFEHFELTSPVRHLLFLHYPNGGIHGLKVHGDYQI